MEADLMLADGAQAVGGKLYILGGGWDTVHFTALPTTHPMAVALQFRVSWSETNERHSFKLEMQNLDGVAVQPIGEGQFEAGRPPGIKAGTDQKIMLALNFGVNLTTEGEFVIAVMVDGNELTRVPFRAAKQGAIPGM